jgi:hypothetical protein
MLSNHQKLDLKKKRFVFQPLTKPLDRSRSTTKAQKQTNLLFEWSLLGKQQASEKKEIRTHFWREEMPQTIRHTRQCHTPEEKYD